MSDIHVVCIDCNRPRGRRTQGFASRANAVANAQPCLDAGHRVVVQTIEQNGTRLVGTDLVPDYQLTEDKLVVEKQEAAERRAAAQG